MEKIISLFKRDYEGDRKIFDEVVPGAEWVVAGEGVATRKMDGTCCLYRDGKLWKRYDAKKGKIPPDGWVAAQEPDPKTGHHPGWLPVGDGPEDKWHREGILACVGYMIEGRTYELCGPKVQGNPEELMNHQLLLHGGVEISGAPRTFEALRDFFLASKSIEGIVWHHPDGRMVKIKGKDFGIKREVYS